MSPGSGLALIGFLGLCLLVGVADAAITETSVHSWYPALVAPPGKPPNWVFPVVWTTLYVMMAVAAWLVWRHAGVARRRHYQALRLWGWQLLVNALWTPAFFGLHNPGLALGVILALLVLLGLTIRVFLRVDRLAAALLAPYFLWVCYATWLNAGFWWLNSG